MRRLSVTIFLSLLASLLLVGAAVAFFWQWRLDSRTEAQESRFTELLAAEVVPAATEGVGRLQETLSRWHRRLRVDLQVVDARGRVLAAAGRPFRADGSSAPVDQGAGPAPAPGRARQVYPGQLSRERQVRPEQSHPEQPRPEQARQERAHPAESGDGMPPPPPPEALPMEPGPGHNGDFPRRGGRGMTGVVHRVALPDDRTLLIRTWRPMPPLPWMGGPVALPMLFLAVALAAWPVSRRITRRLETLQRSVDAQAAGNLQARVEVQGRDEVAQLARSFNRAAERIETLVTRQEALLQAQRRLLANASHELRSPLARIRMAVELMLESPGDLPLHAGEVRLNIHELDALVEEILLASRLDAGSTADLKCEPVDMQALAAEEAERTGAVWVAEEAGRTGAMGRVENPAGGGEAGGAGHAAITIDGGGVMGGMADHDRVTGGASPWIVQGDVRLLRRLLRNLLENARRYQPAGGEPVLVRLSRQDASQEEAGHAVAQETWLNASASSGASVSPDATVSPNATVSAVAPAGRQPAVWLCIAVMDRGPGVPEVARERIFEAFYRVDGHSEQSGNVGLGLSLVRQIARRHGGDAHHEPREGGGSVFVVRLPAGHAGPAVEDTGLPGSGGQPAEHV